MNGRRKVFEKQIIDYETGEVSSVISEYTSKNIEKFFLGRTTDGIEWVRKFNNTMELYLFLALLGLESVNNGYVITLTSFQIDEYSKLFKCSVSYVRKCLGKLVENDFLIKVGRCNYLANPDTFYVGGSKVRAEKRLKYVSMKVESDILRDKEKSFRKSVSDKKKKITVKQNKREVNE